MLMVTMTMTMAMTMTRTRTMTVKLTVALTIISHGLQNIAQAYPRPDNLRSLPKIETVIDMLLKMI